MLPWALKVVWLVFITVLILLSMQISGIQSRIYVWETIAVRNRFTGWRLRHSSGYSWRSRQLWMVASRKRISSSRLRSCSLSTSVTRAQRPPPILLLISVALSNKRSISTLTCSCHLINTIIVSCVPNCHFRAICIFHSDRLDQHF